jgi:hypothetical protein
MKEMFLSLDGNDFIRDDKLGKYDLLLQSG